jgi:hypothetical protein
MADHASDLTDGQATEWMQQLASVPLDGEPLPDAQVLWWKAQALRRVDAELRITRPMDIAEYLHVGIGFGATVAFLVQLLGQASDALTSPVTVASITTCVLILAASALLTLRSRQERLRWEADG